MARTAVIPVVSSHTGTQVALAAFDTVNGMAVANQPPTSTVLIFRNTGGAAVTVTLRTNRFDDGDLKLPDRAIQVPAGGITMVGTFPSDIYNQSDGSVWVDASGPLQFAALQIV